MRGLSMATEGGVNYILHDLVWEKSALHMKQYIPEAKHIWVDLVINLAYANLVSITCRIAGNILLHLAHHT